MRNEMGHDRENVRPGKCKESEGVHSPASIPLPDAFPCNAVSSLRASPYHASSRHSLWLRDPEGDSGNQVLAEAVLQPLQHFAPAVADDFCQPHIAVHLDE